MRVTSIDIAGYRGIPKLHLEFSERVNVIIGVNGAGKSAILDCIAIMLSRLVGRIRSTSGTGRLFSEADVNNDSRFIQSEIEVYFQGEAVHWRVTKSRRGRSGQRIRGLEDLRRHVDEFRLSLEENELSSLPLAVYYPVNRAVLDIPLRIRKRHPFDRLSAYDQALSGIWNSFRIFFEWFREREDLENERRLEKPQHRDPQLVAVRRAIERFLPGFKNLKIKRAPLRMIVRKNKEELIVNQLSDGEKCMLAMVGDLARRMAIANPNIRDPLRGDGIVLIDEVDLHLHPAWQRHIATALEETFPNCQFLLSTHSPAILSQLEPNRIWILERVKRGVEARRPEEAYGQSIDRIFEDIMSVSSRPIEVEAQLSELFLAIEQGKLKKAKELLKDVKGRIGRDPDLVRADVLIQRKEALE